VSDPLPIPVGSAESALESETVRTAARIGRNFSFRMIAQILSALINVGGMVVLGNYLSAEGYGEYVFYYALIPLIGSLSDLGTGVMIVKEIARDRDRGARYYGDALMLKAIISGTLLAIVGVSSFVLFDPGKAALITMVCATATIDFGQDVSVWMMRANERLDIEALMLLLSQIAWIGGLGLGVVLHASLAWLLAVAAVAFLLRTVCGLLIVRRRFYRPRFDFDFTRLKDFVVQAAPFGLAMFFVVLYGRIGVLMLKALGSSADVALFNVGYMLSQPLGFISTALSMAAFPAIARHAKRGPQAIAGALRRTSKYQFLVTFPLMAGLVLLSGRVIPLLFHGADFRGASLSLRLMSLGLTLIFVNLMSRYLLAAIDEQRIYLTAVVVGLVANLGLGFLLIPRIGFAGACVAQLAGETAIFVMCQRALTRYVPAGELAGTAVRPAIAALGMAGVVWLLRSTPLVVPILAGAVTYAVLLLLIRAFTREEIALLKGMLATYKIPGVATVRRAAPRP